MQAMLVVLWTHEPFAFTLYNASKHADRTISELEMDMAKAAYRVAAGEMVWIPNTVAHTNTFNENLKKELILRRDNSAGYGGGEARARAQQAAKEAKEQEVKTEELVGEVDRGLAGIEAPLKKAKSKVDTDALAKMRDQLGLFD